MPPPALPGGVPFWSSFLDEKTIALIALPAIALLAACTPRPASGPVTQTVSKAALPTMERIALAANSCWFKSKDKDFRSYTLAPELNSYSGRPRILVVPGHNPQRAAAGRAGGRQSSTRRNFRPDASGKPWQSHPQRRQSLGIRPERLLKLILPPAFAREEFISIPAVDDSEWWFSSSH